MQNLLCSKIATSRYCFLLAICLLFSQLPQSNLSAQVVRKSQASFRASDGLLVTADLYQSRKSNPYIILLHQEQSCRGEFDSITTRFIKMNYNCMAIDLRSGDNLGFIRNETAARAKEGGYSISLTSALKDIEAGIKYLYQLTGKNISLFGSASSASLALIVGRDNKHVNAIVAFSPGEYFRPEYELKSLLINYPKPVFIACTTDEFVYLSSIETFVGPNKVLFKPTIGEGQRGTKALLSQNPSRDEYWLSLLFFFKSLQK